MRIPVNNDNLISGDRRGRNPEASDRIHLPRRSDNGGRPLHEGHKAKNRTGLGNVWHNEQSVEVKQHNNSNQGETIRNICHPGDDVGSECWCLRKEDERRILVAEMSWLRRILGRSRRERIRNEVTRKELGQQVTLVDKLRKRRLTWFGHVTRMEGNRLPVVALYGQVEGTRSRGRQPKKWIDNVKEDLMAQGMNMRDAVDNSRNRRIWRSLVEASSSANA